MLKGDAARKRETRRMRWAAFLNPLISALIPGARLYDSLIHQEYREVGFNLLVDSAEYQEQLEDEKRENPSLINFINHQKLPS